MECYKSVRSVTCTYTHYFRPLLSRAHIETQATQPALGEAAQVSVTHVFDNDSAS